MFRLMGLCFGDAVRAAVHAITVKCDSRARDCVAMYTEVTERRTIFTHTLLLCGALICAVTPIRTTLLQ